MAPNLILASQSPRRKDLLEQAGLAFEVIPGNFDEDSVPLGEPESYARVLAMEKANQIADHILTTGLSGQTRWSASTMLCWANHTRNRMRAAC